MLRKQGFVIVSELLGTRSNLTFIEHKCDLQNHLVGGDLSIIDLHLLLLNPGGAHPVKGFGRSCHTLFEGPSSKLLIC
jgi:hypothetical protein